LGAQPKTKSQNKTKTRQAPSFEFNSIPFSLKSVVFGGAAEVEGFDPGAEGGGFEAKEFGGAASAFETPAGFF
jgi:hypothetical protein